MYMYIYIYIYVYILCYVYINIQTSKNSLSPRQGLLRLAAPPSGPRRPPELARPARRSARDRSQSIADVYSSVEINESNMQAILKSACVASSLELTAPCDAACDRPFRRRRQRRVVGGVHCYLAIEFKRVISYRNYKYCTLLLFCMISQFVSHPGTPVRSRPGRDEKWAAAAPRHDPFAPDTWPVLRSFRTDDFRT